MVETYATFHTLHLDTLATQIFESGWDYVGGDRYEFETPERNIVSGRLIFKGNRYDIVHMVSSI